MKPAPGIFALAIAALMLAGCATPGPETPDVPAGERKPAPRKIRFIDTPKAIREDVLYPRGKVKQSFFWQDQYAEWRFNLPVSGFAYAGFRFRPLNLSPGLETYTLSFDLTPAHRVRHLWLALVDGDDDEQNLMIELPLEKYASNTSGAGTAHLTIPLRDFPLMGIPVHRESSTNQPASALFDWRDVREVRMIHHGGRMPAGDCVITEIKLER